MRRYTDYQDSGSDWIGQVPKHWDIGRLKDFVLANPTFKVPHDMTADDLVEFVPMTNVDETLGVISRFDLTPLSEVASGYRRFCNGDVIFAKITPCMENGNCAIVSGLSRNIGFGSTEFLVYRPKRSLNARYLHYFLHNDLFRKNAVPFMKGSAGQKRLPNDYVETHVFPLPPLPEQQAIADYLDAKTAQIDRKIDLLTQKAAKYRQLKRAIINAAVTRGLDNSAPMKDSGVEWIGEVPAHWTLQRLKDIGKSVIGLTYAPEDVVEDESQGTLVLRSSNIQNGRLSLDDNVYVRKDISSQRTLRRDDILICSRNGSRALIGKNITIDAQTEGCTFGAFMTVYRSKYSRFISHYFNSMLFESQSGSFGSSTINQLTITTLNSMLVALPPRGEQHAIADYLDTKTVRIDRIIEIIDAQITKLQDLRKSLINAVVTGKLRVT
mgnify:CR=1 FL=1